MATLLAFFIFFTAPRLSPRHSPPTMPLLVLAPTSNNAAVTTLEASCCKAGVIPLRPGVRATLGRAPGASSGRELVLVFTQLSVSTRHCSLLVGEVSADGERKVLQCRLSVCFQ